MQNLKEHISEKLSQLSESELREVLAFVEYIANKEDGKKASYDLIRPKLTARKLLNSGLIGIWKDRTDITDSSKFARKLREQAQKRTIL